MLTPERGVFAAGTSSPNFYENEPIIIEDTPPAIVIDPNVVDLCDSPESSGPEDEEVDPVWGRKAPVDQPAASPPSRRVNLPRRNIMSIMDINLSDSDESDDDSEEKAPLCRNSRREGAINAIFDDSTDSSDSNHEKSTNRTKAISSKQEIVNAIFDDSTDEEGVPSFSRSFVEKLKSKKRRRSSDGSFGGRPSKRQAEE
ncbi:Oidioi.mRNA.OKI2018_I69.chr1.g2210.t1.cds [Oikopleura dioica]|uniref:Oidioi.mRNA.OKI2018_I69.chr1.g2210.t1.cds n=1 Tax=Oikopleura dioica TaxID=34765 RepID=A0ABN7STY5_OIKDI|nr:Oidioi.mRNA.OKI2018_I69.chr1.g2210.t1.cds [Oikopleura dioica]